MILAERFRQINADQIILTIKSIGIKLITIFSKTKSPKLLAPLNSPFALPFFKALPTRLPSSRRRLPIFLDRPYARDKQVTDYQWYFYKSRTASISPHRPYARGLQVSYYQSHIFELRTVCHPELYSVHFRTATGLFGMGFSEESGLSYRVLRNIFRVYFLRLVLSDNGRKKERVRRSTELFTNKMIHKW